MSVRMRHTSSHSKNRRSHHALTGAAIVVDKESGALRLPHRLDETTGMYRGKQIISKLAMKAEAKKDKIKARHKKEHIHAEGAQEPIHAQKHDVSEIKEKKSQGILGRMTSDRTRSRSGMGGGTGNTSGGK